VPNNYSSLIHPIPLLFIKTSFRLNMTCKKKLGL
jgi:hypothetical protein